MTPEQEKQLLAEIQVNPSRFGELFDQYYKPIFGYIFRRTGDYDISRDIAAETFMKAFLKINTFQWKGVSIGAWLYKIATNEVNSFFRKKKYQPLTFQTILDHEKFFLKDNSDWLDEKEKMEQELQRLDDFVRIQQKLKNLDLKYQEVIALRYFENKDNKTIGHILQKPEGTIKSLLARGLEKLRKSL
jgi:RNA polymerase sigma factor (sigma-70 family)